MSGLFGSKSTATETKVIAQPDTDSPAVKKAQTDQLRRTAARSGRTSTNLSSGGSTLPYTNSLLGQ